MPPVSLPPWRRQLPLREPLLQQEAVELARAAAVGTAPLRAERVRRVTGVESG